MKAAHLCDYQQVITEDHLNNPLSWFANTSCCCFDDKYCVAICQKWIVGIQQTKKNHAQQHWNWLCMEPLARAPLLYSWNLMCKCAHAQHVRDIELIFSVYGRPCASFPRLFVGIIA